ncbi:MULTISPECIES: hypothetical protein [unclassified Bradyrhizobium]|nr:hypothetical protein [Bradyrhizobium sp. CCBAU 25338]
MKKRFALDQATPTSGDLSVSLKWTPLGSSTVVGRMDQSHAYFKLDE